MSWANSALDQLAKTGRAKIAPRGNSMHPLIKSGDEVLLESIGVDTKLPVGTVVLVRIRGKYFLHLITKISTNKGKPIYLIGNNHGRQNGWVERDLIYGKKVEEANTDEKTV